MTEYFDIEGGRIAYEVAGDGPLVVLAHGLGDRRQVFRFVVPQLVGAGFRVASVDMRGHGDSSTGDWKVISRTIVAGDLIGLIRHLGGPAVLVGHSLAGGAATIAAATAPELVSGLVEIGPFTKAVDYSLGGLIKNGPYRRATFRLGGLMITGRVNDWFGYLDIAYPTKPADYDRYMSALRAKLAEPGRKAELLKTLKSSPADAAAQLPNVTRPTLIVMGDKDPDFADPRAEAEAIVAALPSGIGSVAMIAGGGHYPQAQCPDEVARLIIGFVRDRVNA